jgi:peptidoglycan pentaglycine glycine transferase (the first glycine)
MIRRSPESRQEWNQAVERLPGAHILQSWEWGEFKSAHGWEANRFLWLDGSGGPVLAAAQVLSRTARIGPFAAAVQYIPKGPVLDWKAPRLNETVLSDLEDLARRAGAIQIKLDPDIVLGAGQPGAQETAADSAGQEVVDLLRQHRWLFSAEQIQFRNTAILDLLPTEEALLAGMKQKTRYNVRVAQKHGVVIRPGTEQDFSTLYQMYAETATRDGFIIRPAAYYLDIWSRLMRAGMAQPLIAEVDGMPVAGLILFVFAKRGWYFYGMSRELHREKMPNYLLQWEAIRWLRERGCASYDMWGAPDEFVDGDPLWGVYRFKLGFGAATVRHLGAWDYAPSPIRYRAYHGLLPRILNITRALSRRRTRSLADSSQDR